MPVVRPCPLGSRTLFLQAFIVIAFLFAVTDVASMLRFGWIRDEQRGLVEDSLTSVALVSRMARDLDREQLVLSTHIHARDPDEWARLEGQLAALRADYGDAASEYQPLTTEPGEAQRWQQLERRAAALQAPLDDALALSRSKHDGAARAALARLEGQFAEIDRDADALIAINREAAAKTLDEVERLQRSSLALSGWLAAIGIALSLAVFLKVLRLLRQREDRTVHYSAMLEARNRELDAFAGRVAHDLRGPLSTIGLAASQLARRVPDERSTGAALGRGVERMRALIDDLLELSRLGPEAPRDSCDPAAAAANVREELAARFAGQDVSLIAEVEPARVQCREALLREVLWNLTDNAVKYRRAGVTAIVEVRGAAGARGYELRVRDNGIGMSPDEATHAFEPFFRAGRAPHQPGTGLGLSIVKRVVEAHGGTVTIDSRLGHGTTFVITLQLERA